MKRYMVFATDCYYPMGGMNDFVDSFDTLDQARQKEVELLKENDRVEIYDLQEDITI